MNLRCFDINDTIFNKILTDLEYYVEEIDKLENTSYYDKKRKVLFIKGKTSDEDCIICQGKILNYYTNKIIVEDSWKQVILRKNEQTNILVEDSIDGGTAWAYMLKILMTYYTRQEIDKILQAHTDTIPDDDKQYHYDWPNVSQNVQKRELCVKYDINGAHTDALCELFPKCKQELIQMYVKRHTNIKYKKIPNFFVGMLKNKGYDGAYWWIVQRTTKMLKAAIDKVGGILVYVNTDGFCVQYPNNKLPTSNELGDFKEEYKGTVYIYTNRKKSPYILYQFGNELKGSCMTSVRKDIDLSKGNIVYYKKSRTKYGYEATDIVKETICVE